MAHAHHSPDMSLNRLAFSATAHCLTGCGIGEVLGLVIGTALGWGTVSTIALAVVLAFFFGYSLTLRPLLASKMPVIPGALFWTSLVFTLLLADFARAGRCTGAWDAPGVLQDS